MSEWVDALAAVGCEVAETRWGITRVLNDGNVSWVVAIPNVAVAYFSEPVADVRSKCDRLFGYSDDIRIFGVVSAPFPEDADLRQDAECFDLDAPDETFSVEMTRDWMRFYLMPPVRVAATPEELQGQEPMGWRAIVRALSVANVKVAA